MARSRVFLDVSIGVEPAGRITIELYDDKVARTCENFRALCTSDNPESLTYKMSTFHRVIDEFMIQGGDITKGDGTGGQSIYGSHFEDENIGWRDIDTEGLLCMANRGKDTNNSQFFITLCPCEHLNRKHTVFGRVVSGMETINRIAGVKVDKNDRPLEDVIIARCGELERKKSSKAAPAQTQRRLQEIDVVETDSSVASRGRDKPRSSRNDEMRDQSRSGSSIPRKTRRRSDAAPPDPTLRGRGRKRSHTPKDRSPSPSRRQSRDRGQSRTPAAGRDQRRSPQQFRDRSQSPRDRRERGSPDQRDRYQDRRRDDRYAPGPNRYGHNRNDYSGGRVNRDDYGRDDSESNDGVKYKGRGSMKFREPGGQSGYGRLQ